MATKNSSSTLSIPTSVFDPHDDDIAERDPSGRYIRYNEILGRGAFKIVYKAFDEVNGIEVAWNQVHIDEVLQSSQQLERLYTEVHLLKSLKHVNIMKCYYSWVDNGRKVINMITELFTSGSLRRYRKKHKNVDMKAIKNWARHILNGLQYLHGHCPCIIHGDLKCDNVFVNGNTGEVKIGDLGLATVMQQPTAQSVIGTPEFMAPELYEEEYNELIDIYSFGMCMLEMVTCEYPYGECSNVGQIYLKVSKGKKPNAPGKVTDRQVKQFIERCLVPASLRPSAKELLMDPFLVSSNLVVVNPLPISLNVHESAHLLKSEALSMEIDLDGKNSSSLSLRTGYAYDAPQASTLEVVRFNDVNTFKLVGELEQDNSISMSLLIAHNNGEAKNIHFVFYLQTDTSISVVNEMVDVKCLKLSKEDVNLIVQLMEELIGGLAPHYTTCRDFSVAEAKSSLEESTFSPNVSGHPLGCLQKSRLLNALHRELDGKESVVSGLSAELSSVNQLHHHLGSTVGVESFEFSNSEPLDGSSLESRSSCWMVQENLENNMELKQELDAIDSWYDQCVRELWKRREEAIGNAKKRWSTRNRKASVV